MNIYEKTITFGLMLLISQYGFSKPYFQINAQKTDNGYKQISITQRLSEEGFKAIKSIDLGLGKNAYSQFSKSGKYLSVFIINKRKIDDEVVIFSTQDFKELSRIKV